MGRSILSSRLSFMAVALSARASVRGATFGRARAGRAPTRIRLVARATANLSPETTAVAVSAALRGDATALADATGHAVNAFANVGLHDVSSFVTALAAPPVELLRQYGDDAKVSVLLTAALMIAPMAALLRWRDPATRKETESARVLPLLSLFAAQAVALARIFVFTA